MPRSQRNDNFIKTFTVVADILIKVLPTSNRENKLLLIIAMVCRLKLRVSMLKRFKTITKL
jgi:hypothetical protein